MSYHEISLRKELIEWCGYIYDEEKSRWYRPHSAINLKSFALDLGKGKYSWYAYKEEQYLCEVTGLSHLIQMVLILEGDQYPIGIKVIETTQHENKLKEKSIAFINWSLSSECEYGATDENQFTHNSTGENITTEELYNIFKHSS